MVPTKRVASFVPRLIWEYKDRLDMSVTISMDSRLNAPMPAWSVFATTETGSTTPSPAAKDGAVWHSCVFSKKS